MADEARLARIEEKLDRLSEAVVALARIEERMITLFNRSDLVESRMERLSERVNALEKTAASVRFGERLFWIIVTVGVGAAASWLGRGGSA